MRNKKLFALVGIIILISTFIQTDIKIDNANEEMQIDDDNNNNELRTAVLWTVDDDGPADFKMVQEAINAASPGDTIIVYPGTYTENIIVDKSLTINSESSAESTIIEADYHNDYIFYIIADNVIIDGFTIRGAWGLTGGGIYIKNANYCTLSNNIIAYNALGIYLEQSLHTEIISNQIVHQNNMYGIIFESSSNNIIINNSLDHNFWYGIYLTDSSSLNIIENNNISNNAYGVKFYSSNNNDIINNNISSNRIDGIYLRYSNDNSVINNTISDNDASGISLESSSNNYIEGNNITLHYNKHYSGIYMFYSANNYIYLNTLINNFKNAHSTEGYFNFWNSPDLKAYIYKGEIYTNYLGNYWDDYVGNDPDGDGRGNTPYIIDNDEDNYPLMGPFGNNEISHINNLPNIPSLPSQLKSDGVTLIPEGGTSDESTVGFKGTVSDPDRDQVQLEIELREIDQPFTGEPTQETISDFVPSDTEVTITRYGLVNADYHWQYRAKDSKGATSDWVEYGTAGNTDFTISNEPLILDIDEFLLDPDPLTRYLFNESIDYFIRENPFGELIWDVLDYTKITLVFEIDLSKYYWAGLLGFSPKIEVKVEAWKEGDDIYIEVIPVYLEDITFSGPFSLFEGIISTVSSYPGVDLEINVGVGGAFKIKWNTITNSISLEEWNVGIVIEFTLSGKWLPFLLSLVNPIGAKIFEKADHFLEKFKHFSIADLCTSEAKFRIALYGGHDSDGYFLKLEVKPRGDVINVDFNLDGNPEIIAGIKGTLSFKWNSQGLASAGEMLIYFKININIGLLIINFESAEGGIKLFSFDTTLWDPSEGGGGDASSLRLQSASGISDIDLDGLSDYYENILGTSVNNPDTDDDDVSDYFEVFYGTNPLDNDTDSDGLSDYDEIIIYNSNPIEIDTDDDGITDFDEVYGTYDGVITNPILDDTDLDGLSDGQESNAVNPANPGTNASDYDTDGDGYSDGDEINKYSTDPLNPASIPVDTDLDGMPDIDENEIGTDPNVDEFSLDTDSDTIPDIIEELVFKTNKNLLDSDSDGYNDTAEIINGTNPNNPLDYPGADYKDPDTDGDGLPDVAEIHLYFTNITLNDTDGDSYDDLEEILGGSDPNDPSSIPEFDYHSNFDDIEDLLGDDGDGGGDGGGDEDGKEAQTGVNFLLIVGIVSAMSVVGVISVISAILIKKRIKLKR